ncbi:TlpA family protein disulfide reductase [Thioalkalivibrio thiocyanodenitrificans]|uniref:TlpA family protein disulfide reductase n=1 Tax=Thioalkalivibrio thiocyanodenitrificans TaxID=243063 RepID=UPI000381107C|nr:TlpA disulfide reductase family protein [Thioalkalivibrio thiocyanodenitrificans]
MPYRYLLFVLVLFPLLILSSTTQAAEFTVPLGGGDRLDVQVTEGHGDGPLFVWLINQYGERRGVDDLASRLAARGATVWQVDLLKSLLLQRDNETVRALQGDPVAALLQAAADSGLGPVVVIACDRMSVPLLRGLRTWQEGAADMSAVAGGVLFFPNLFRGTPVAGEDPELMGITGATTLPVAVMQPELGTHRLRLAELLETLHRAGSPAYGWLIPGMRDYYLFHTESPDSGVFEGFGGEVPPDVRAVLDETPARLMAAARLLTATPRPERMGALDPDADRSIATAYGLVERPAEPAPGYDLLDARGERHTLEESLGRVTLVNFWATWCPPCVHEIPSMNRLAAAYHEDEFAIVSINFQEDAAHILAFMDEVQVDFPVLMDVDGAVSARWRVFALPSSFLLDARGRVRYSVNTAIEWDTEEVRAVIDRLRSEE